MHSGLGSLLGIPITDLDVSGCEQVTDVGLAAISNGTSPTGGANLAGGGKLPISTLSLRGCSQVTDAGMGYLALGLTTLQRVDLAYCQGITDIGLSSFEFSPSLASIDVTGCRGITSAGTEYLLAEYLEAVGPGLQVTRHVPWSYADLGNNADLMVA